jgi:hypothetical protein
MVVKGAVSIVEDALRELDQKKLADALEPERKAAMISNLLSFWSATARLPR